MRWVRVLGMIAIVALPRVAHAGNEDSFLFGEDAAITGGAVVATTHDPAAIWYNPAGLGENRRGRIELSGTVFTLRLRPIPAGLALDLPSGPIDDSISSRKAYVVPGAVAVAKQFGPGMSLGLGLFVTELDVFNYSAGLHAHDDVIDLDVSGALSGSLTSYHAGPSIGYQVSPRVRIGASLFGVYEDYRELRKLFASATETGAYESTFFQRLVDARTYQLGLELVVGTQIDAGDGWRLGFTARSPRLVFDEFSTTDNSTVLVSQGPTVPTIASSTVDHTPIDAEGTGFTRPARFVAGAAKSFGTCDASAELDLRPSGVGATAQRAVWNARAAAVWNVRDTTALGFGLFTDRSGAALPTTFPDYRVDYYGVSAGWKRHTMVHLRSGESASTLLFSTTISVRYALGLGESTRIRFDFRDTAATGLVGRVADERVDVVDHELSLYLGSGFEF